MPGDDVVSAVSTAAIMDREIIHDCIQLLCILHVDPTAELIVCRLQRFPIHETDAPDSQPSIPAYEALSYAWGPTSPQRTIQLNGEDFPIRENLWQFLYHAGTESIAILPAQKGPPGPPHYKSGWLWVDAICIDQRNVAARSREVQRMSSIYQKASRVISWLGVAADFSDEAVRFVHNAVKKYNALDSKHLWPRDRESKQPGAWLTSTPDERRGLLSLLARPYWARLWVVQEVVLAELPFVACGRVMLEMWDLTFFKWTLSAPWLLHDEFTDAISQTWPWLLTPLKHSIERRKRESQKRSDPGLFLHVLERFSDRECEDPRDKVYGLVGLADPRHVPKVDYSLRPEQVFWEAVRFSVDGLPKFSQPAISHLAVAMGVTGLESESIDQMAAKNLDAIYATTDFTDALLSFRGGSHDAFAAACQRVLLLSS